MSKLNVFCKRLVFPSGVGGACCLKMLAWRDWARLEAWYGFGDLWRRSVGLLS